MATLLVTFQGTNPAPLNGYKITYAPEGSPDNLFMTLIPNALNTTVYIPNVLENTGYVVRVQNDCGNGNLGPVVEFTAGAPLCNMLVINAGSGSISYTLCNGVQVNNQFVNSQFTPVCIRQNSVQLLEGNIQYSLGDFCTL